jgi:hypothetical protein
VNEVVLTVKEGLTINGEHTNQNNTLSELAVNER